MDIRVRGKFDRERMPTIISGKSITKQAFKEECNINNIMAKFQKTGIITHVQNHSPQYGDFTGGDYTEAMNVITKANSMFQELPSSIRKEFENDPAKFLDFVSDEKNIERMVELGLAYKLNPISSGDGEGSTKPKEEPVPGSETPIGGEKGDQQIPKKD